MLRQKFIVWSLLTVDSETDAPLWRWSNPNVSSENKNTPRRTIPILTGACARSKIPGIMNAHVVSPGMKQNHPQTMMAVPEGLEETYT